MNVRVDPIEAHPCSKPDIQSDSGFFWGRGEMQVLPDGLSNSIAYEGAYQGAASGADKYYRHHFL